MLSGRVHGFDSEDQVGRSELPVPVNKYLGPEYKIQIPNVDFPEIRDKHFAVYKIYIYIYIYDKIKYGVDIQISKTTISGKTVKLEINTNPLQVVRGGRGFLRQTNCRAPG